MHRAVTKVLIVGLAAIVGADVTAGQSVSITSDTTVFSDIAGDPGTDGVANANGTFGAFGAAWNSANVDVIINSGVTVTGGLGGSGGPDTNNDGGNDGAIGGTGLWMFSANGTLVTNSGVFVYGGGGGNGSDGGAGGAFDTFGGFAGNGGVGISGGSASQITLNGTVVVGGAGGNGGSFGNSAGIDDTAGRAGGTGGAGMLAPAFGSISLVSSSVTGGAGGAGGSSPSNTANVNGGNGGHGILVLSDGAVISIDAASVAIGGDGGSAGAGGSGGHAGVGGQGVSLVGQGTALTNHGLIRGGNGHFSANVDGAGIDVEADTTLIDNFGTIEGQGLASGILLGPTATTVSTIHNRSGALIQGGTGVLVSTGAHLVDFHNDGTIVGLYSLFANGQIGTIHNTGSMSGDVVVMGDFNDMGLDNLGGTITGNIYFTGNGDNYSIVNSGTLNSQVYMSGAGGGHQLINSGTINGDIFMTGGGPHLLALDAGATITGGVTGGAGNDDLALNGGTILGAVDLMAGQNSFTVGGVFATSGIYKATGGAIVQLSIAGTGALTVQHAINDLSSVGLLAGGSLNIAGVSLAGTGTLFNSGTVSIAAGSSLQMNAMSGGGSLIFGVDGSTAPGQLLLTGGAVDLTGASVQVNVQTANALLANGTNLKIADGVGAALGVTNGLQLADNSALMDFVLYRGDALSGGSDNSEVYVQAMALLLANIAAHGDDPNAVWLGGALDTIGLNGDGNIDALMQLLAQQQTDAQINDILDSLLPETEGVAADIAIDAADQVLDVASRRLDGLRGTATASLPYRVVGLGAAGLRGGLDRKGVEVWGQAFGRLTDQRRHAYDEGYDAGSYGFAAGADTAFDGGRTMLGASVAYSQTDADGDGVNRTATGVDSTQVVLYGDHLFENSVYAKGLLGYGWHASDIARHNVGGPGGATVRADYDAWSFAARAETGRAYAQGNGLTLTPRAVASYVHYEPDEYTESGPLGLSVVAETMESFRLGLGVTARWDRELDADTLLQPELRLDYRHDVVGDRFETISEFAGATGLAAFRTAGVAPGRDILNLGVGALLATAAGVDVRASYDLEVREDYLAHGGFVRASVAF